MTKRYTYGKLAINEDIPCRESIERWIRETHFLRYETSEFRLDKKSRKRNRLYCFHSENVACNVVMKVSEISKDYTLGRRINLHATSLFKDYNYNSYAASIQLIKAGIDTLKPIAYWTYKTSLLGYKSYFLYEKIESGLSVTELCNAIISTRTGNKNEMIDTITDRCIAIVQKTHASNIRHGDPHGGNILTNLDRNRIDDLSVEDIKRARFVLIDNDRCVPARISTPVVKRFYDLKCLARFNVCRVPQENLLRRYLGDGYAAPWGYVLRFWKTGGFSLRKRLSRK